MNNTTQLSLKYKVIVANVNSIVSNYKRLQLLNFLEKNKPDLLLINKTKLNKKHTLFLKNYDIIRMDRDTNIKEKGTAL